VYLGSPPTTSIDAIVMRIDLLASFTPENTYLREERAKQVVDVKILPRAAVGVVKPRMPADGAILVEDAGWPVRQARP
jgi:hypothetical protein